MACALMHLQSWEGASELACPLSAPEVHVVSLFFRP